MVKSIGIKRILPCLLLSVSIVLSSFSALGAEGSETSFSEKNEEAYGLVSAISDCEKYLPIDAQTVTRGMFISAVCAAAGISPDNGMTSAFEDVAAGTELFGFVSYAVQNGIISDSAAFRPDDAVTAAEAEKIIINMFGYGIKAEKCGGWPSGYRNVSSQIGLLSGVGATLDAYGVYRMIFNMLNADSSEMYIKGGKPEYRVEGESILSRVYEINKITGKVTSNGFTETGSLAGSQKSVKSLQGTMGIDGVKYDVKTDAFNSLIGCRVRAYIKTDDETGNDTVVYMHGFGNDEVTVSSGELRFEDYTLYDDKTNKKYKIGKSIDIIVNGKVDYSFPAKKLAEVTGSIRLIASGSASEYNAAVVTDYKYMKVSTFDRRELEIADMDNAENRIKITDDAAVTVYSEDDGGYTTLGSITKDSYLAVAASKDGEVIDITIMANLAEGKINSISDDEIVIGDKTYSISEAFRKNGLDKIRVGSSGSFYIGKNNDIVAASSMESTLRYGYLVKCGLTNGIKKKLQFKIFTQSGDMTVFDCADRIKIDGDLKINPDGETLKSTYFSEPCFLRYGVDGDGRVNVIDLPEKMTTYKNKEQAELRPDDNLTLNSLSGSYYFRSNIFYPSFFAYEATVFFIPLDRTKEEDYQIGYTFNEGAITDGTQVEAYDVGLDGNAKAICTYMDAEDKTNVPLAGGYSIVVEKVYQKADSDGFYHTAIRGWSESGFVDLLLKDGISIEKFNDVGELSTGDIIRVLMKDNEVSALVVDFCGSEFAINKGSGIAAFNCRSTNYHYQTGSVYSLYNSSLLISKENLGGNEWDYSGKNLISVKMPSAVLVVNAKDRKISMSSEGAVKTYLNSGSGASRVVIKQTNGNSNYCVIYEGLEDM